MWHIFPSSVAKADEIHSTFGPILPLSSTSHWREQAPTEIWPYDMKNDPISRDMKGSICPTQEEPKWSEKDLPDMGYGLVRMKLQNE